MAPSAVQATASAPTTIVAFSPPAPPSAPVQEVSASPTIVVTTLVSLVGPIVGPLSTIVAPLLRAGVTTTSAPKMPPLSSASPTPPSVASPFSCSSVSVAFVLLFSP